MRNNITIYNRWVVTLSNTINNVKNSTNDKRRQILKRGTFYTITDESDTYVLLDNTKSGLAFKERTIDTQTNVNPYFVSRHTDTAIAITDHYCDRIYVNLNDKHDDM